MTEIFFILKLTSNYECVNLFIVRGGIMNNDKNMEVVQDLELVGLKPIRMDGIVNWNNKW